MGRPAYSAKWVTALKGHLNVTDFCTSKIQLRHTYMLSIRDLIVGTLYDVLIIGLGMHSIILKDSCVCAVAGIFDKDSCSAGHCCSSVLYSWQLEL